MSWNRFVFAIAALVATSGCSMEASLQKLASEHPSILLPAKASGLVAGSSQIGTATDGVTTYHVQSTVGNFTSEIAQETTDGSYKIYGSVQGALISE